jgi:carbamoyl-phosphate synthase small subunit
MKMTDPKTPALLALADGTLFWGTSIGAEGRTVGEVVFNTAMTGYQEIITDPSYARQIVTLTYPHIGNTGINSEDNESERAFLAGLIIRNLSSVASNWRSEQSLSQYLREQNVVGISEIDTRQLTRILRDRGAQHGCIITGQNISEEEAIKYAKAFPGLNNLDLAKEVSTQTVYTWTEGSWSWPEGYSKNEKKNLPYHVVVYDYGVKRNILRLLVDQGCHLTVVPATTPASEALALKPDGLFFSNGPGDPAACDYAIEAIKELLSKNIPLFGICLGFQLLALACGGKTEKMKFGHHGANHPVQDRVNNSVAITSQNHGFAVCEKNLPSDLEIIAHSMFDGTPQGIRHKHCPAFGYQGHPEASPGPHDMRGSFAEFIELIRGNKKDAKKN